MGYAHIGVWIHLFSWGLWVAAFSTVGIPDWLQEYAQPIKNRHSEWEYKHLRCSIKNIHNGEGIQWQAMTQVDAS